MKTKTQDYFFNKLSKKHQNNIIIKGTCWLWQKNINGGGYGRVHVKGKRIMAHIYMYKLLKGSYEKGLVLDHVYCEDKNCCNPTHLSPVTHEHNVNRGSGSYFKTVAKPFQIPVDNGDWLADLLSQYSYIRV